MLASPQTLSSSRGSLGMRLGEFGPISWFAGSVGACYHCRTKTNLGSDWSIILHWCGPTIQIYIAGNGIYVAFLWLASHMTALKLQSHWSVQIPFPGPRIVSKFIRLLFPCRTRGWSLGCDESTCSRHGQWAWLRWPINRCEAHGPCHAQWRV